MEDIDDEKKIAGTALFSISEKKQQREDDQNWHLHKKPPPPIVHHRAPGSLGMATIRVSYLLTNDKNQHCNAYPCFYQQVVRFEVMHYCSAALRDRIHAR
mmetsp:Transcript_33674/g.49114  ORF Transcript_33674/g.49114 Transcript_33674/m.49114 type:complete len:100 (-) Transcript_33674:63-362(-)